MTTITKERLLTIKQWRETYGPGSNVVLPAEEAEELARIALASLEAEPVSQTYNLPELIEGMEVSVDVSTCDADAGHCYFGTVTEISELDTAKNGYILLVQDAKPNFKPAGNSPATPDDVLRMDWLVSKTVDVREPMVYGSHSIFWSQTITDEDDDYHATKLREQIDAAMAAEQAAAPQQENV